MVSINVAPLRVVRFKGENLISEICSYIQKNVVNIVAGAPLTKLENISGLVRYLCGDERVRAIECIIDNSTPDTIYLFGFIHNYSKELGEALKMRN